MPHLWEGNRFVPHGSSSLFPFLFSFISLNYKGIDMQIDATANCSIVSQGTYLSKFSQISLMENSVMLKTQTTGMLQSLEQMECAMPHSRQ